MFSVEDRAAPNCSLSKNSSSWQFVGSLLEGPRQRLERHQLRINFWLHLLGIPLACAGLLLAFFDPWWGLLLLAAGYLLQYVGHCAEGNDMGEWAGIKRSLGLPYVAIAPRRSSGERMKDER